MAQGGFNVWEWWAGVGSMELVCQQPSETRWRSPSTGGSRGDGGQMPTISSREEAWQGLGA